MNNNKTKALKYITVAAESDYIKTTKGSSKIVAVGLVSKAAMFIKNCSSMCHVSPVLIFKVQYTYIFFGFLLTSFKYFEP